MPPVHVQDHLTFVVVVIGRVMLHKPLVYEWGHNSVLHLHFVGIQRWGTIQCCNSTLLASRGGAQFNAAPSLCWHPEVGHNSVLHLHFVGIQRWGTIQCCNSTLLASRGGAQFIAAALHCWHPEVGHNSLLQLYIVGIQRWGMGCNMGVAKQVELLQAAEGETRAGDVWVAQAKRPPGPCPDAAPRAMMKLSL